MSRLVCPLLIAGAAAMGPALALWGAVPDGRGPEPAIQAALVPPWRDAEAVVAAAGGRPVGPWGASLAILATPDPAVEDFAGRLRTAGAWLVIDATRLAAICGVAT